MPVRGNNAPVWGSTPEPPKIPSLQIQPGQQRVQVDHLAAALERVVVTACNRKRCARNQQGSSPLSGVVSVTNFICTKFRGFGPGQPKGYQLYLFLQISRRQFYWLRPDKSYQLYFYPTGEA